MTKRTAIIGIMAAATISITACGSGDNGITDTAGDFTPANTAQTEAEPAATNTNLIHKNIGEAAGIKNPAGGDYLNFTATNITRTQQCQNVYGEPLPGEYIQVTMHIITDQLPIMETHVMGVDNWTVTNSDGTTITDANTSCEGSTDLLGLDETGTRDVTFYLKAPTDAATVRYTVPNQTDATVGWEWNIP